MTAALVIFKKDVRRLWPQIALFLGLLVVQSLGNPATPGRLSGLPESVASLLLAIAGVYLIVTAIHQEALPGERQYWLTRPLTWRHILSAKALFVAVFINGAVFLTHVAVLAALGIPVLEHVATLLWFQVILTALLFLPAAALGAITNGLPQVILFCFSGLVAYLLGYSAIVRALRSWGAGSGSTRASVLAAAMIIPAMVVVILQYRDRRTFLSRAIFLAAAVGVTVLSGVRFSPSVHAVQRVTLRAASARLLPTRSAVDVPIHIDNLPRGVIPVAATIELVARRASGQVSQLTHAEAAIHDFSGADGWLTIYESRQFFTTPNWSQIDVISGELTVRLFAKSTDVPVPLTTRVVVPGIGVCFQQQADFSRIDIACLTPFPRASLAIESADGRKQWIVSQLTAGFSFSTPPQFDPIQKFTTPTSFLHEEFPGLHLVVGQLLGTRDLTFTYDNPRLIE